MLLPEEYATKVYAGVLGKIIGVYLGRPFEGWTYERIMKELGEVDYYVNEKIPGKPPLVVTDDDLTGTFTFLRALEDYGISREITPAQIGQTWLNYIIEGRTIFWWGGFGNSTEHTAYLRLKNGVQAPDSGSIQSNGKITAEQIGAQIFIDGWAMVAPGNPDLAVELAGKAASVSHDGEAVYAAKVLAAMESQAFIESDINKLLDLGITFIPKDSVIYQMIADIRNWHAKEPDWHATRRKFAGFYNYENFPGVCHVVPNHGLIILGLLYGNSDFDRSMMIVNTSGWDTDCNSGNLGCLLGIQQGLAAFEGKRDWRAPILDRLYMPTADGGRSITDAAIEAQKIIDMGAALNLEIPFQPKESARFHFEFPGSMQGFRAAEKTTILENVEGHSQTGKRCLKVSFMHHGSISTPTFILPGEIEMGSYKLIASPTIYSGQKLQVAFTCDSPIDVRPLIKVYNFEDVLETIYGPKEKISAGQYMKLNWTIPNTHGQPITETGISWEGGAGNLFLDYLTWGGEPNVVFTRPQGTKKQNSSPTVWRQAWVDGMDLWKASWKEPFRLVQNDGCGLIIQGTREWRNYEVEAEITPWLIKAGGIGARVQGMRRFYALQFSENNKIRLVKSLDGMTILAEKEFIWKISHPYTLKMRLSNNQIMAWVNGELFSDVLDKKNPLLSGGVAYVVEQGLITSLAMRVNPIKDEDR
jgi:ADP-ribosylglycohydrolase